MPPYSGACGRGCAPVPQILYGGEDCLSEASSAAHTTGTGVKAPEGPRPGATGFGSFCRNKRTSSCGGETPHEKEKDTGCPIGVGHDSRGHPCLFLRSFLQVFTYLLTIPPSPRPSPTGGEGVCYDFAMFCCAAAMLAMHHAMFAMILLYHAMFCYVSCYALL